MERWTDAERTNNGSGKKLFLYSDINYKIRWAYPSRNYVDNFTSVAMYEKVTRRATSWGNIQNKI